jgi:hypothetical protein
VLTTNLGWTCLAVPPVTAQVDNVFLVNFILQPHELLLTMNSDLRGSSLASYGIFERDIQRRVRLIHLQCEQGAARVEQLAGVLQQAILLVASI